MDATHPIEQSLGARCKARSKRTGKQCKRWPIPGGAVCVMHGGGAPQVKARAEERLAALVNPSIARLGQLIQQTKSPAVALAAARDVLDRNGIGVPPARRPEAVPMFPAAQAVHSTSITQTTTVKVETLTDNELETLERLLIKAGVPPPMKAVDAPKVNGRPVLDVTPTPSVTR